ncbi:hypothetical protein JTE90_000721 [Oedothorax gibbosus]|uniref:Integrase catalytic domain-containing protein n=1 Tax=Oedothorax gibbosus TaxID=931172 RepID=A0AAV6UN72_9ARAC|nr:hypothetical protein JTE90_000721 [Oedothorax gibbosus]
MKIVPVIQEVFSKINVDACGPLPVTPSGKRYLLTAMCLSSKYPDAVPVEDITSVTVVDALLQIFSRMGFPKVLQLDQGSSFTSALSTSFLEKFGIKVVHSSVYHPQSNPIERFHRTVKRVLKVLCLESGSDWEQAIYPALFALRTVTHESTGFTPAELVHGKNLRTPLTLLYEKWLDVEETEGEPVTEYVFSLINRMKRCQELAISKMEECQQKNKTWYDKRAVKREFRIGDLVLIFATFKSNKLSPHWTGPGTILRKLSETNYVVQLPGEKATSKVYHVNMLKPYYKRPEEINYLISDLEGENDEEQMEIPCVDSNPNILDLEEMFQDYGESSNMNEDQIAQMKNLIWKYMKCFSNVPGKTELVMHDIELSEEQSILSKPYRTSPRQNAILKTEIQKMLDLKIIEIGFSDCTSPMILVEAPGKDPRPCIDYRNLNKITKTKFFPLPNIEERIEIVSSAQYITVLDLSKGYWQIPLTERAQRLAAFVTNFGTYKPLRMPFGLKNAPYEFRLAGYYSRYIPMFSSIAAPLTDSLKGKARKGPITWTKECEEAFDKLKNCLCIYPVLYSPDYQKPFIVETDASDQGMGVVLSQLADNETEEHPIIYLSKKFTSVEKRYSVSEKECAAIIFAVSKLKCYLDGNFFQIVTDHNPLVWLNTHASSNARLRYIILQPLLQRYIATLTLYCNLLILKLFIERGKLHQNADGLSRIHTL